MSADTKSIVILARCKSEDRKFVLRAEKEYARGLGYSCVVLVEGITPEQLKVDVETVDRASRVFKEAIGICPPAALIVGAPFESIESMVPFIDVAVDAGWLIAFVEDESNQLPGAFEYIMKRINTDMSAYTTAIHEVQGAETADGAVFISSERIDENSEGGE